MTPAPGQVGFAHTKGFMGRLIRLGEWMRFRRGDKWNHEFVLDRIVDGVPYIIQATLRGVTDSATLESVAPGGEYVLLDPPDAVDVHELLVFCRRQVGVKYGVGTILAIAIDVLTWDWFPSFRGARKDSWICSALINEGLRYGGWLHEWVDIYSVTPAQGYAALTS